MSDALFSEVTKAELAHRGWRMVKDRIFGVVMGVGGVTVIIALVTIFFYLLWVVFPLFKSATLTPSHDVRLPADLAHLSLNEHGDVMFVVQSDGKGLHDLSSSFLRVLSRTAPIRVVRPLPRGGAAGES